MQGAIFLKRIGLLYFEITSLNVLLLRIFTHLALLFRKFRRLKSPVIQLDSSFYVST